MKTVTCDCAGLIFKEFLDLRKAISKYNIRENGEVEEN